MGNTVIKVEDIGKRYRLGLKEARKDSLVGQLGQVLTAPVENFKRLRSMTRFSDEDESIFWALRNINFEVNEGEVLGIIGHNGAGKSTLLKLLSKITYPSEGKITLNGRVAALLEVGTGFHQDLTGRENIYMNGTILGMTKKEIDEKLDEIIAFSGVEKHIDTRVKFYSSGMKVRLGFAVAAHLEPEILIIDEVLAVGDAEFQRKCLGKMEDVSNSGRTVLFVSHNMESVEQLCTRAILLREGNIVTEGKPSDVIREYLHVETSTTGNMLKRDKPNPDSLFQFTGARFLANNIETAVIQSGNDVKLEMTYVAKSKLDNINIRVLFVDNKSNILFCCNNYHSAQPFMNVKESGKFILEIPKFPLTKGEYFCHLRCNTGTETLDEIEFALGLKIENGNFFNTGRIPKIDGVFLKDHEWKVV